VARGARALVKAVVVRRTGGPDVLELTDVPMQEPSAGQVRIRVEAVGINFIEVYQREGHYPLAMPYTPGSEAAGVVDAVGAGVADLKVGDRVGTANALGAYAEYALAPADKVVAVPAGLSSRDAAAALLQGMTAHYLTHNVHPLRSGEWCLVHAAAGGVGMLLCQMAKRRGARVIGTTSTEAKAAHARAAGADEVILYTEKEVAPEVRRITGGEGVRVVYDSVGRSTFEGSLDSLGPRGTMALFGQSSGAVAPFDPQTLNRKGSLFLTRPKLQDYTAARSELLERAGDVLGWVQDGSLRLTIEREFPLADAAGAHRALESRKTSGKLLLVP
jgi:NADPH:quinone reductase